MTELLRLYADIAFFRRGPQDLPASRAVLGLSVAGYFLVYLLMSMIFPPGPGSFTDHLVFDVVFTFVWYWLMLRLLRKPERFLQTASAAFGYQTIIAPLWVASVWLVAHFRTNAAALLPASMVWLGILVWTLAVNVRILRSALEWPTGACAGVVLLQTMVELLLFELFPAAPPTAS